MQKRKLDFKEIIDNVNYLNNASPEELVDDLEHFADKKKIQLVKEIHHTLDMPYGVINCMIVKVYKDKAGNIPVPSYFIKMQEGWMKNGITTTINAFLFTIVENGNRILNSEIIYKKRKQVETISIEDWTKHLFGKQSLKKDEFDDIVKKIKEIHQTLDMPYGVINCLIRNTVRTQKFIIPSIDYFKEEANKWLELDLATTKEAVIFVSLLEEYENWKGSFDTVGFLIETDIWEQYKSICKNVFKNEPLEELKKYIKNTVEKVKTMAQNEEDTE